MKSCILFFLLIFLVACSENSSSAGGEFSSEVSLENDAEHSGMAKVFSRGAFAVLGTNDIGAKSNERPRMKAEFDYDFSIGKREATCGEFQKYFPKVDCGSADLPAVNVTLFDAALFANARSKEEGLDTAYVYTAKAFDSDGHATNLENFEFLPEVSAYRLPTEAEWVLVASQNWNPGKGWNSNNSDYELRKPCTAKDFGGDSSNAVCDMAGNAMEWVNDFMGNFADTVVSNFVGSKSGNSLGERVVKGGSFRNSPSATTLRSRGDVYTVTASTRADYVGFRLAFGKIPNATWLSSERAGEESSVKILVSSAKLKTLLGTARATLAFRDDETGNIGFVNFYGSNPRAVEIPDTVDSYHPAISPDGKRVAFCTKPEGISGKSELYVRNLDANGSGLVRLDVESAAVPRWRVVGADTQIVYVTSAGNNSDASDWKSGSTWAVGFSDGKFGEPAKLFDGTYNGGVSADGMLAVTGARLLRASVGGREELWYGGEQACNASLEDSTKRTLFLDFGSATGTAFAGSSYLAHEMLLVADGAGRLSEMVPSPSGKAFDHTEWVRGKPGVAISSLTDAGGAHSSLALVDTRDSSVTVLAEGAELWHPDLWVGKSDAAHFELDPDSAGVYYSSAGTLGDYVMRIKMELLWRYKDSANVVVLGSSRPLNAVSAEDFSESFFVLNLAQTPNSMFLSREILEKYVYPHVPGLKYLILSLDIDFWWKTEDMEDASLAVYQRQYPGYAYDENHGYWQGEYPADLLKLTENGPGNRDEDSSLYSVYARNHGRAFMGCISWGGDEPQISKDSTFCDNKPELIKNNFAVLRSILESTASKNVHVVGVIFPQSPAYKSTGAFGRYGLRRSKAKVLLDSLKGLETEYANFSLMDENKFGDHDYGDDVALDYDHLCHRGAAKISVRLDSLLRTLEAK